MIDGSDKVQEFIKTGEERVEKVGLTRRSRHNAHFQGAYFKKRMREIRKSLPKGMR